MPIPRFKDPRQFYRAAYQRFAEVQFLLERSNFTTASVYLAGYGVECILKALLLYVPSSKHAATFKTFRTAAAHDFEWLKERLAQHRG